MANENIIVGYLTFMLLLAAVGFALFLVGEINDRRRK